MVDAKQQILDIAMNLTRIGNWAADGYEAKHKRIATFLDQTNGYVEDVRQKNVTGRFKPTFDAFYQVFQKLHNESPVTPTDTNAWAETMMTWGNILTHRASLLER
ncbi:MAG: hypothetical protein AAB889_04730 [Patescibacteria group bacterium]